MQRSTVLRSLYCVMGHRPAVIPAALVAVRSLIGLLRDDRLDPASAQAGAARPRGVRLIGSYRVRPGARAADRSAHPDFLQHRDEPGLSAACPGASTNASGRQRRSAARWTLLVSPPRATQRCRLEPGPAAPTQPSALGPLGLPSWRAAGHRGQFAGFRGPFPFPRRGPFQRRQDLRFHHRPGRVVMGAGDRGVHANQKTCPPGRAEQPRRSSPPSVRRSARPAAISTSAYAREDISAARLALRQPGTD